MAAISLSASGADWQKTPDGLVVNMPDKSTVIRLQPYADGSVRVTKGTPAAIAKTHSYIMPERPELISYDVRDTGDEVMLVTPRYNVSVSTADATVGLFSPTEDLLVMELADESRPFAAVNDSVTPSQTFMLDDADALYGLGEFRDSYMNLRGKERELIQFNTQSAVPVIWSVRGWGMMWDNPSRTVYRDTPEGMSFSSDRGDIIDYYFFAGEKPDDIIASYRLLTGAQPMLPAWAFGYHQSRNRYHNEAELVEVASRMKELGVPMASIFIDYHYWGKYGTGSHRFDESLWPDIKALTKRLRDDFGTHSVITMWPCFKEGIDNYNRLDSAGAILHGAKAIDGVLYDPFNPEGRRLYREMIADIIDSGIDGWFLDGVEPDDKNSFLPTVTHDGPATKVHSAYPLVHTSNFREALDKQRPGQRHYMLTRCAWAGQQRNGTAIWSGDIPTTFDELSKQIPAGLQFTAAGVPYWTTDIGGYLKGNPKSPAYREVFTRWFQYGTFCPVFRNHGRRHPFNTNGPNEIWSYGDTVQQIVTDYIALRYDLMPYIYSLSARVTMDGYTPMRLLAFDFAGDSRVLDIKDQFMYGPAFLVCPITTAGATSREVVLPAGADWIDYRSARTSKGGTTVTADAPREWMPLYVRAGSVIPRAGDVIEIWPGADAEFALYEDDGSSLDYIDGKYSNIALKWNEAARTLSIGADAKAPRHEFTVRLRGVDGAKDSVKKVTYNGKAATVKF